MEASTGKVGIGEAKGRKGKEEDKEKGKDNGSEESSRGMRDMGQGGGSSKVRGGS